MKKSLTRLVIGAAAGALAVPGTVAVSATAMGTQQQDAARGKGQTRVAVNPPVARALKRLDVQVKPFNGAFAHPFRNTVALRFPISKVSKNGKVIRHRGGFTLRNGHEYIALRRFWVNLNKTRLTGLVNGKKRVVLFQIQSQSKRPKYGDVRLRLTGVAARAINKTFGVKAFKKGATFGFASVRPGR